MRTIFIPLALAAVAAPAAAQSPRELLVSAAFATRDRATALARVDAALRSADAALARDPESREARLQRSLALGYRGKLRRDRGDVQAARRGFEALVTAAPSDPEAQMALAGFHLGAIIEVGPLVARTALGARRERGLQAMAAAVAAGGGRAVFPAFASLNRIQLDPEDVAGARALAEAAVKGRVVRPEDRAMQAAAARMLPLLRAGNGRAAATLAARLMPFGELGK